MPLPSLAVYPRVAPAGRVQCWVGAFHYAEAPSLTWFVNDVEQRPTVVRPLASARPVSDGWADPDEPRVFTGLFEFTAPVIVPGRPHRIRVEPDEAMGDTVDAVRSLPKEIPEGPDHWFNILLISCFYWKADKTGAVGRLVRRLPASYRPDMALLLGDQVYLDLPPFYPFRSNAAWLAKRFEETYSRNWKEERAYRSVLSATPSVSIPDDHEYWNNFPHWATIIPVTWKDDGRQEWKAAAARMYEAFQRPAVGLPADLAVNGVTGFNLGDPVVITVPPLSLFILDSRSCRSADKKHSVNPKAIAVLKKWVDDVKAKEHFGVIATGQSYLEKAADWKGRFTDFTLLNYEDIEPQIEQILELAYGGGRPVILITGDVHWGRFAATRAGQSGPRLIYEVISSPTALVEDPRAKLSLRGLFRGSRDPWPFHSEPKTPPRDFGVSKRPDRILHSEMLHRQKGNHVALLSFQRHGLGIRMRTAYWPVHSDFQGRAPTLMTTEVLKRELLPQ